MQHDEVIWQVIRHNHCSFMSKIETGKFCRNPYNVTGICNRSSCPLANSRYATIREQNGVFYLYMKSIERAHMPKKLWERVKLPKNYLHAMKIIDKHMMFWPKLLVHKIKQRLTKMTQMRIRMRKLALKTREKVMPINKHKNRRDVRRLEKAEKAALIDKSIEKELLERLKDSIKNGIPLTGGVYNIDPKLWDNIFKDVTEDEAEEEIEYVEGFEDLEEEDDIEDFGNLAMTSFDDDQDELEDDDEASRTNFNSASTSKKKSQVTVEVEHEDGGDRQMHLRT